MLEAEGAKQAIQDPNPVIDGRKANVNLAYLGAKPRTASTGEGARHAHLLPLPPFQILSRLALITWFNQPRNTV